MEHVGPEVDDIHRALRAMGEIVSDVLVPEWQWLLVAQGVIPRMIGDVHEVVIGVFEKVGKGSVFDDHLLEDAGIGVESNQGPPSEGQPEEAQGPWNRHGSDRTDMPIPGAKTEVGVGEAGFKSPHVSHLIVF